MDIPWPDERYFCERLRNPVRLEREIHGSPWDFLVEPVLQDHAYAITPDDVARVIGMLPAEDLEGLDLVVFRQPTRKQQMLDSHWGLWALTERLGPHDRKYRWGGETYRWPHASGPAVFLEAVPIEGVLRWSKHLRPDGARELERLRNDGHRIVEDERHHLIHVDPETCRATQLYRVLPHEIGHHVEYWRKVMHPSRGKSEAVWRQYAERFWNIPELETEAFADRYADTFCERMFASGEFPFERVLDLREVGPSGLDSSWFSGTYQSLDEPSEIETGGGIWRSAMRWLARLFGGRAP